MIQCAEFGPRSPEEQRSKSKARELESTTAPFVRRGGHKECGTLRIQIREKLKSKAEPPASVMVRR